MKYLTRTERPILFEIILGVCLLPSLTQGAEDELGQRATWSRPDTEQIPSQVLQWLAQVDVDEGTRRHVEEHWVKSVASDSESTLLDQLAETIAQIEPKARDLLGLCNRTKFHGVPPRYEFLHTSETPALIRHNLNLVYGRWLTDQHRFSEAQEIIGDLHPEDVVAPATLLFYQSVIAHRLIDREKCLKTVERLLENEEILPRRYVQLACLMRSDMKPYKPETLDDIARIMRNIHNRLHLARVGKRVRTEEEEVLEKLKKMIDELEEQAEAQVGASRGRIPGTPAPDSFPGGGTGPGDVDPKAIKTSADWGNLPPKQRQEALQQISNDFPGHYREVIEEYFKKIARDGELR